MNVKNLSEALREFIIAEILPKATMLEKTIVVGAEELGVFNLEEQLNKYLSHPMLKLSKKLWLDEDKTEISSTVLKSTLKKIIEINGKEFKFKGFKIKTDFGEFVIFDGYIVNDKLLNDLFKYIEVTEGDD